MVWRVVSASRTTNGCSTAEGGAQQLVDLPARIRGGHAVLELDLYEPHKERVERPAGCEKLLSDVGKRPPGRDHSGECGHLTAGALYVPDGSRPVRRANVTHGFTNAAPVIPAAA